MRRPAPCSRARVDLLGDVNGGGAGGLDGGPVADADAGEQGCAEGATFFGGEEFDGVAVDVGLDLAPERAARAAAAEADAGDGDVEFGKEGEGVAEAKGDAFYDGADEMGAGVRGGDADEGGAGVGIEMGGALAEEVGRPEEAVAAGGDLCGCQR